MDVAEEVDAQYDGYVQSYGQDGKHIERNASFLEGREEAGAYLEADGEDEQDEAELAYEFEHLVVNDITQMSHQDAHKEHECDAE